MYAVRYVATAIHVESVQPDSIVTVRICPQVEFRLSALSGSDEESSRKTRVR